MQKQNLLKFYKKTIPYLLILLFSILSTYVVFFSGFFKGHDLVFHTANIYDWYSSMLSGGGV